MFNLGFLWLALSIGSEITGTSMIKKTIGTGGLRLRPVLLRPHSRDEHDSSGRRLLAMVRLWYRRRHHLLDDPLQTKTGSAGDPRHGADYFRRHHYERLLQHVSPACAFIEFHEGAKPHSVNRYCRNKKNRFHCRRVSWQDSLMNRIVVIARPYRWWLPA